MKLVSRNDRFPGHPDHQASQHPGCTVHCTIGFVVILYHLTSPYTDVDGGKPTTTNAVQENQISLFFLLFLMEGNQLQPSVAEKNRLQLHFPRSPMLAEGSQLLLATEEGNQLPLWRRLLVAGLGDFLFFLFYSVVPLARLLCNHSFCGESV